MNTSRFSIFRISALLASIFVATSKADDFDHNRMNKLNRLLERHPRDVGRAESPFGNAVHFSGKGEFMRLRDADDDEDDDAGYSLPNKTFSVQFWVKPEGGQYRFTPILAVFDECKKSSAIGWTVGIGLPNHKRENARFVFTVFQDGAHKETELFAHRAYDHEQWTNVAATFDGYHVKLYVNGAEISSRVEREGVIFRDAFIQCVALFVGGSPDDGVYFRGKLDELTVWKRVLQHSEIVRNMNDPNSVSQNDNGLVFSDSFNDLSRWEVISDDPPEMTAADISLPLHTLRLEAPPCGRTVCDDPEVVMSYLNHTRLMDKKRVRYRVVNVMDSNGKKPLVTDKDLFDQHKALNKAFEPYNIRFDLEQFGVRNSTLSEKVIMFDCETYMVGNGRCDDECAHSTTGNDGGDCDRVRSECRNDLLGNGVCNPECNKAYHGYDKGDCCLTRVAASNTCIDPASDYRGYMHVDELKSAIGLNGSDAINVYLVTSGWNRDHFRGVATYPWDKNVFTVMGGIAMHAATISEPHTLKTLVHEMGHALGLWHVHRGVSEMSCDHPCIETHPSMVLGDLCSDTRPTTRNSRCSDPLPSSTEATCGVTRYTDTPYNNYMGYADDSCIDRFTPQQTARMHCYLDLVYQAAREMKLPVPVPVAPKIIFVNDTSVHIAWLTPLGSDPGCDGNDALHQYAASARSSHHGVRWSPHQATGLPDAEKCSNSSYSWRPFNSNTQPACDIDSCWIELTFQLPVIPSRISIWVVDLRSDADLVVEITSPEGEVVAQFEVPTYCDLETTIPINTDKRINKVTIYTEDSYLAIDAVEVVSIPKMTSCTDRKLPKYILTRNPPFAHSSFVTANNKFIDRSVENGTTYRYTVEVTHESRTSVTSPELVYTHGGPFCGDGRTDSMEECDDRNAIDGDGCSMECRLEENFRCQGSPSLCSVITIKGDNCEHNGKVGDCGLSAPNGFIDQWAYAAVANPDHQSPGCPASFVTGKPDRLEKCGSYPADGFWRPCGVTYDVTGLFWLKVTIFKPVVATAVLVHLAADGRTMYSQATKPLFVELITDDDEFVSVGGLGGMPASCESNPLHVPVVQDLSKPFFLTKGVRISFTFSTISIHAVRVRSSPHINPLVTASCSRDQLYNTRVGQCVSNACAKAACGEFPAKYGNAVCSGTNDGDTCKIQCEPGYHLDGHDNKATCVDGTWYTSSPFSCMPVDCGRPEVPRATVACPEGTTFAKRCVFKCDKPAYLVGINDTEITCQKSGSWSKRKSECAVLCDALGAQRYVNGKLKTSECGKGPQEVGQNCKINCQDGYHVEGKGPKARYFRIICDEDGRWIGPTCEPVLCPEPPTTFAGAYTCTRGTVVGSTCNMKCSGSAQSAQKITCQSNGKWDREFELCSGSSRLTCPLPVSARGLKYDCSGMTPGKKCKIGCTEKRYVPVVSVEDDEPKGKATHIRSGGDLLTHCTVHGTWDPPTEVFECVQQCNKMSIGDGFCDADNNRAVCKWDGGDCCDSTVYGGIVLPIPDDCSDRCECKDPTAVENRRIMRRHKHFQRR
ncbi:pappalysin-1-like [Dreissena polymorpha]|uniref:Sushi domain-containing protein n=1 Tax=Dreissena polymorpha TaxID=45954 RepID=A0A9D4FFB3_DREPO|nr:pappalysin-1-like [Dreissena polymorpha]KAH3797262.1 hypothetical protein DPMN_150839 [Dreissena polymorpha]